MYFQGSSLYNCIQVHLLKKTLSIFQKDIELISGIEVSIKFSGSACSVEFCLTTMTELTDRLVKYQFLNQ